MKKLKRVAADTYRGADDEQRVSLTVSHGHLVEVSDKKAAELMAEGGWEDTSPAAERKPVPKPAEPEAAKAKPEEPKKQP